MSIQPSEPARIGDLASLAAALAVVLGLMLIGAGSAAAAPKTVNGSVGPGFTISLKLDGKKVKKLKATTYKFKITDRSSGHNFHLKGPGYNKAITSVGFKGHGLSRDIARALSPRSGS